MGAVFAIFSGVYFWFWKVTGRYIISEEFAAIHFWTTFVGVNMTFFPMHFLGLNGMPRRIPDYPDAFAPLNYIASVGSMISLFAALFFLGFVYVNLVTYRGVLAGVLFVGENSLTKQFINTRLKRNFFRKMQVSFQIIRDIKRYQEKRANEAKKNKKAH